MSNFFTDLVDQLKDEDTTTFCWYKDQRRLNLLASFKSLGDSKLCITLEIEPLRSIAG